MGLGVHGGGVGVTRYLVRCGAEVTVTDRAAAEILAPSLRELDGLPIRYVLGEHREEDFRRCELLVRNPSVPDSSPYLTLVRDRGVPIETELSLFWQRCPSRNVIGVTGSKGKSTTTRLVGTVLEAAGLAPVIAGNLTVSALDFLAAIGPERWVVLELSSYQLEGLRPLRPRPRVAVLTSLYADHLDRHGSVDAYRDAKAVLFRSQEPDDFAFVSPTSPAAEALAGECRARVRLLGPSDWPAEWPLRLPGAHNRGNAALALATATAIGIDPGVARGAIADFAGLPHRLELVADIGGVRYYDDAQGTIPEATRAAFDAIPGPIVWIAGGVDKGLDQQILAGPVRIRVRAAIVLSGSARPHLEAMLGSVPAQRADAIEEAVSRAAALARPGESVLFSPAAGMPIFALCPEGPERLRHVSEWGSRFQAAVRALRG